MVLIKNSLNYDIFHRFLGGELEIITKFGPNYRGRIGQIDLKEDVVLDILFIALVQRNYIDRSLCYSLNKINYRMKFNIKNISGSKKFLIFSFTNSLILYTTLNEKLVFFVPNRNILNIEKVLGFNNM
jgi:hypothetical protein